MPRCAAGGRTAVVAGRAPADVALPTRTARAFRTPRSRPRPSTSRPEQAGAWGRIIKIWQGGRTSLGSTAATYSSCTRSTATIRRRSIADTRALFEPWTPPADADRTVADGRSLQKIVGAVNLAQSIRRYGHLAAQLDPLGSRPPLGDPSLLASTHGVTDEDLRALPATLVAGAARRPRRRRRSTRSRRCAASTARRPATTTRTSSCPRSGDWLRQAAEVRHGSARRPTRSIRSRCSTG